ncbi:MAG: hypothetical protein KJ072_25100 [Verrucomicrobia bacterium]|nr:hypothetical protein [Verrucomicrobiota bacterium]
MRSLSRIPILLLLLAAPMVHPDTATSGIEPVPQIDLEQRRIEVRRLSLRLNEHNLQLDIRAGSRRWETVPPPGGDLTVWHKDAPVNLALADARDKRITAYRTGYSTGLLVELGEFGAPDTPLDLRLTLIITLEGPDEDLVCEILAREGTSTVSELRWPGPFAAPSFDLTVVPFMQGVLIPKDWPEKVWLYDTLSFGRGLYMPWWGHQQTTAAVLVHLETPDDAGCAFDHPPGGPTQIGPRWVHSLRSWSYPRRVRYSFIDSGDYVDLAKRYRRHALASGRFVSLREKIARNSNVGKLIGTPVIHTSILYHIQPESSYYNKERPDQNHQLVTFTNRASALETLANRGIRQAYVHLDGWGFRGYDNLHPDPLPPCPEAGGWNGFQLFASTCARLGFIFAIHDQYRDYYLDAPSYDPRHTLIEANGQRPIHSTWYGGRQSILCPRLALGHVRKNHQAILDHHVPLQGAYLDVFAVVPPEECYAPEHPMTRTECLNWRGACLDFVRSYGGIVSSEEPSDWAVPHLDLVHHGPYPLRPNPGSGPAMAIPVPLFNLVYHDALLIPWSLGRGAWGIPDTDLGFLHGLGNAGLPYLSLEPDDAELERVRTMCALHQRVGLLELTRHRFLDASRRRQEFTYADGTRVTIDLDHERFDVAPPLP